MQREAGFSVRYMQRLKKQRNIKHIIQHNTKEPHGTTPVEEMNV
jgi:hypothetical protein